MATNTNRMTDNQKTTLKRILRADGKAGLSPTMAGQLIKRGLVYKLRSRVRKEWNRPVATLWVVMLTTEGRTFAESL